MTSKSGANPELVLMKRAGIRTTLKASAENMEPLKWPIAPDGYIPNSVIRSWMRRKELNKMDCLNDLLVCKSLHKKDEGTNDEKESTRTFWLMRDEEEEEEEEGWADDVQGGVKEKEDGVKRKDKVKKTEVEAKKSMDGRKDKKEDKMERCVPLRQSYVTDARAAGNMRQLETCEDRKLNVELQDVYTQLTQSSTQSPRKTVDLPTSCRENKHEQLRELKEDVKTSVTTSPQLQSVPVAHKQRSSVEWMKPPKKDPEVSAETMFKKMSLLQEPVRRTELGSPQPRITSHRPPMSRHTPPVEPENLTHHPLKAPPPTPEHPPAKPVLRPRECSLIRAKTSLLSSSKYNNNNKDQAQGQTDREVLELFKKIRRSQKNSKAAPSTIQTDAGMVNLRGGQGTECLGPPVDQTMPSIKGQKSCNSTTARRTEQYQNNAGRAATQHLGKSSETRRSAETFSLLQPVQAPMYQRVVYRIQMMDPGEPASTHFHHITPMASRLGFVTSGLYGKTQYGRLLFEWVRGSQDDSMLKVIGVKMKGSAVPRKSK